MRVFRFRSILYIQRCAYILSSAFFKFKCLAAKHVMFEHSFLVSCSLFTVAQKCHGNLNLTVKGLNPGAILRVA